MNTENFNKALLILKSILPYAESRIEDLLEECDDNPISENTVNAVNAVDQAKEFLLEHYK